METQNPKKILIIGGVAGGATAAARARRTDETAEITVLERGPYVSYANCGLPYFIAGDIQKRSALLLQTPEGFDGRYGVKVHLRTEAVAIDRGRRTVRAIGPKGEVEYPYDALILAQGGNPIAPSMPGADAPHVFRLWTVPDMDRLEKHLREGQPKTAVVVGGGFIGLEMAEAFARRGLATTVVELAPTVMSLMDPELGHQVAGALRAANVAVMTGVAVAGVNAADRTVTLTDGQTVLADLVLFSVGVRPELTLAREAGLEIGASGGLAVNAELRTSDPHIWAAGDMVEVTHKVSGRRVRVPLAGPANRQGRIAATNALGGHMKYNGALGTSVVKIFEHTAAMTGLSEKAARDAGFDVGVAKVHKDHHAGYYPGGELLSLTLVYDRKTGRLLGAQAFGKAGVEKRVDVLATALHGQMTLEDLTELDLAYAPPYSSANDPINLAAFVGENDRAGVSPLMTPGELRAALSGPTPPVVLDVRTLAEFGRGHIEGARHVPVDELRWSLDDLPRDRTIAVYDRTGFLGHLAVRILKQNGFPSVYNVTGGYTSLAADLAR
jgi:NADPH-dependent 2,4-dienoyl-CoA reductase/sulfur reductase-like enzyme/rhodanese-related sulfurtransferase